MSLNFIKTAELNFIDLHIKVKQDRTIRFLYDLGSHAQSQGRHQTFCVRTPKLVKGI